ADAPPSLAQWSARGFTTYATTGTAQALEAAGISAVAVAKIGHGRPNVIDVIDDGRATLVVNTVSHFETDEMNHAAHGDVAAAGRTVKDGERIRLAAEQRGTPCWRSPATAAAPVRALARQRHRASPASGPGRA